MIRSAVARIMLPLTALALIAGGCGDDESSGLASCDTAADEFIEGLFGASVDAVTDCLGDPDETFDAGEGVVLTFPDQGLEIGTANEGVNLVIAFGEIAAGTDRPDYNAAFEGTLPDDAQLTWQLDDFVDVYGDPARTTELAEVQARYETFTTDGFAIEVTRGLESGEISSITYRPA